MSSIQLLEPAAIVFFMLSIVGSAVAGFIAGYIIGRLSK